MSPRDHVAATLAATGEFAGGEHLLVWSWRRIAAGRGDCPLILREFARACGEDTVEVFATFHTFLRALAHGSRRRLRVGWPGASVLTGDERQLLALIAAAQAGHGALFEAHLRWLARGEFHDAVAIAAQALGRALKAHALCLAAGDR